MFVLWFKTLSIDTFKSPTYKRCFVPKLRQAKHRIPYALIVWGKWIECIRLSDNEKLFNYKSDGAVMYPNFAYYTRILQQYSWFIKSFEAKQNPSNHYAYLCSVGK